MRNKHPKASFDSVQGSPSAGHAVDYSPRTYTLREKIIFSMKLFVVSVIAVLLLWLMDR